jgi:hypothetical protein
MLDTRQRYDHFLHDQYVNRFVAYSTKYPFDIVAVSGWFCLGHGFPNQETTTANSGSDYFDHPYANRNLKVKLRMFNVTMDCPPIQFPTTLTDYKADPTKAIIGYGVNDCYPVISLIHKQDIINRLLGIVN